MNNTPENHSNVAFMLGYVLLFYLLGVMIWPYLSAVVLAAIFAGTFYPLMIWFQNRWKIRHSYSALLTMLIMLLTLLVPTVVVVMELAQEAVNMLEFLKVNLTEEVVEEMLFGEGYLPKLMEEIFTLMNQEYTVQGMQALLLGGAQSLSAYLLGLLNSWMGNLMQFVIQLIVMLVVVFSILWEGERIKKFFLDLSPLPTEEEELMLSKFNQMNYVTMVGNGIGGVIQGGLAGIGFWFFGFESVILWTTLMVILAFIPVVGMSFVYVPACIYLYFMGQATEAIILFTYCTIIALVVEQWFKPKFVGNRVQIHSTLVFLSIISGMSVFGFLGIFYGPLVVSIFLTFVELYHKRYTYPVPHSNESKRD